jgi:hypothetical protein
MCLAINVKDVDFLKMDKPTITDNHDTINEWNLLDLKLLEFKIVEKYFFSAHENKYFNISRCFSKNSVAEVLR